MLSIFEDTWSQLVAFYLAARLGVALNFAVLSFTAPMVRGTMLSHGGLIAISSALWICSIYVELPARLTLIWVAIALDLFGSMAIVLLIRTGSRILPFAKPFLQRAFEFYPAVNIEHKVERTNAFVTLVFGYSVVALLYQNSASFGLNAFFGKAVLGLIQAFCLNTIYFEIDGDSLFQHAVRRSIWSCKTLYSFLDTDKVTYLFLATIWMSCHLPFLLGYSLSAGALSRLVLAHDCNDAEVESLTESYSKKSEADISPGLTWFYCAGMAITLISMVLISLSHVHKSVEGIRITKLQRLANRSVMAIIVLLLPLAHSLNSLQLLSITTGCIVEVTVVELYGASCRSGSFFGGEQRCKYTARCHMKKGDLESAVKNGDTIKVEELAATAEKGIYDMS